MTSHNTEGTAAYNTVYGGKGAYTGPTLSGCTVTGSSIVVEFNTSLLAGDALKLNPIFPYVEEPNWWINSSEHSQHLAMYGGSLLYVQTNASDFCMEAMLLYGARFRTGICTRERVLLDPTPARLKLLHACDR
jgi:hypothetical protein